LSPKNQSPINEENRFSTLLGVPIKQTTRKFNGRSSGMKQGYKKISNIKIHQKTLLSTTLTIFNFIFDDIILLISKSISVLQRHYGRRTTPEVLLLHSL
jgi:hypothetical protein